VCLETEGEVMAIAGAVTTVVSTAAAEAVVVMQVIITVVAATSIIKPATMVTTVDLPETEITSEVDEDEVMVAEANEAVVAAEIGGIKIKRQSNLVTHLYCPSQDVPMMI